MLMLNLLTMLCRRSSVSGVITVNASVIMKLREYKKPPYSFAATKSNKTDLTGEASVYVSISQQ